MSKRRLAPSGVQSLARFGVERLTAAIDSYWSLGEPHAIGDRFARRRRRESVARVMVDTLAGLDAAFDAVRRGRGLASPWNRRDRVLSEILDEPEAKTIEGKADALSDAVKRVRLGRNHFLHAGRLPSERAASMEALREALSFALLLYRAFPELRKEWQKLDDAVWEFFGQHPFVVSQMRDAFSGRTFPDLGATLRVDRDNGDGLFVFAGPFTATGRVNTYFWRQEGEVPDVEDPFANNSLDIGAVALPDSKGDAESGEEEHEGVIECVVRGVEARTDGFDERSNPLLRRILLSDQENSPWTYGPGILRIDRLRMSMPYRVRTSWYATPEPRTQFVSSLIPSDRCGTISGRLRFYLQGHVGRPAFRGAATVRGSISPVSHLLQRAEWKMIGGHPAIWAGVTRLHLRTQLRFDMTFDEF